MIKRKQASYIKNCCQIKINPRFDLNQFDNNFYAKFLISSLCENIDLFEKLWYNSNIIE